MPSNALPPSQRERGTTLVDVVVTLAIVVVLASAFAAEIRNVAPGYRWEQGTQSVVEILRQARQQAIAKNVRVAVKLIGDRLVALEPDDTEIASIDMPQGVTLTFPALGVLFMPTSSCSKFGAIEVTGAAGGTRTININPATGRVRVS